MKGVIGSGVFCGVAGFIAGIVVSVDGSVGSLVLGFVLAMIGIMVLGAIGILLVGVITRNQQPKQTQRQSQFDQPQGPMLIMTGQPQSNYEPTYNQPQLPLGINRQQVEYEDY
jgi:hypothetical protein